jgi:hypothetical protein
MKAAVIILVVLVIIVGLLFTLRTSRNAGAPSADVLKRAEERAKSQRDEDEDD